MKLNENKLIKVAKPYFTTARSGDWEHALRVVRWVKELGVDTTDLDLLITAAYIHDIGWSGVAPQGKINFEEMIKLEQKANDNSSRLIKEVVTSLYYDNSQIKKVERLVGAADAHKSNRDDEEIIVDADSLSKLCIEHLQQKYQPESFSKVVAIWESESIKRMKTKKGIKLFPKL